MSCRWIARDQPRILPNRHAVPCALGYEEWLGYCNGCQPCPEPHCRVCDTRHHEDTCPECVDEVRETLAEIGRMCGDLPGEAETKGVDTEAFNLLGPVCDPEARGHVEASYRAGRLPEGWLETGKHGKSCPLLVNEACTGCGANELHPLTVMWWWNECYREAFDHDETPMVGPGFGILDLIGYLDRNLTYAAGFPDVPFDDFAGQVRSCRTHLEAVLHDGEQRDTGAPCMNCGKSLERAYDYAGPGKDGWKCLRCGQSSTEEQYRFAVMHLHREEAEWLTDRDMAIRTGVKAGTVRSWARADSELVRKKREGQRTLYAVADVLAAAQDKGLVGKIEPLQPIDLTAGS